MGCNLGGSVIANGLDNGDGGGTAANGQLEPGEVDYSTTFCTFYNLEKIIDINPGTEDSYPEDMIVFNNALYFEATTELTEMNCGSMMELMLQVWLLISILEVAIPILTIS